MTDAAPKLDDIKATMPDIKVDPDQVWVKAARLGPIIAITICATAFYMQFKSRMDSIEEKMDRDVAARSSERADLIKSVEGVRDQLRAVFVDQVAVRQAQNWIELARALNRDKFPGLVFPDLPR